MLFETILCSVIAALVTTRLTYYGDTRKALRNSREKLYTELFSQIEKLLNNSGLVFEDEFMNFLVGTKPKIKLIASDYVVKAYVKLYELCANTKKEYEQWLESNDPFKTLMDEDEIFHGTENDIEHFNYKECIYRQEHVPSHETISLLVGNVLKELHFDIGNRNWKTITHHCWHKCYYAFSKINSAISK